MIYLKVLETCLSTGNANIANIFNYREQQDSVYEAASMAINVGLWYTKHAAKLAAKEE